MLGVGTYLWRLVPANPILLRVVQTAGKRKRDVFVRSGYLGVLVLVVLFSFGSGSEGTASLTALASMSARIFQQMSFVQLTLVALLAPIFTAGAITQEKDSQTYDILLSTPLTNGQIVLGSLLSRLFFIVALLISGIPIFSITQIFGGVAIRSIVMSFLIAAATAFVCGALAMAIATFKVGTRRTIFSFYLFVVLYLIGGILLDQAQSTHPVIGLETDNTGQVVTDVHGREKVVRATTSWLTGINPFLALRVIFHSEDYMPPERATLPPGLREGLTGFYLSRPDVFYVWFMFGLSLVLVLPSIVLLRRMAQTTGTVRGWILQMLRLGGERTQKPRSVWLNPIAWREARTKASAARTSVLRYGFIVGGMIAALIALMMFSRETLEGPYITTNSYNPVDNTLTIFEGDAATTYRLVMGFQLRVNGEPALTEALHSRMKVVNVAQRGRRELGSLDLVDVPRRLSAADTRSFLLGAVIVEFAVILLIVTNAAASTVTREKEDGSLDLLLATPITSRYYIWGKLRGLVSYVLPLVAVPVASVLMFNIYDMWRVLIGDGGTVRWLIYPETVLVLPGLLIIVAALASILGMQMSLRCRTTVRAVMSSVGIVLGVFGILGWCGYGVLDSIRAGGPSLAIAAFSPFTLTTVLIDPSRFGGTLFQPGGDPATGRVILLVFGWSAIAAYAAIVWTMYKSMVKNFDMTIRRQSR